MSKRSDGLVANMLGNRWRATTVVNGASAAVTCPAAPDSQSRPHLETIWYSIKNINTGNHTVALQVRHAGGTLVANVDHFLGSSVIGNFNVQNAMYAGKRGGTLTVAMNTALASVTYSVNAAGWFEDVNG